ncbi:MAG: hypothetical protein DDT23_00557 [candidate division WS2 bacterium]|nr:hypothetical protein [Candidatus Lithacetigena glycinireducens]
MSKCYTLEEVRSIRDEISKLGERKFDELEAKLRKAEKEFHKAGAKWSKLHAKWSKTKAEWDLKLFTFLVLICPEAHYRDWGGYLAIPKSENEEWIIPVFTGDFFSIKHKAFSIWEMPKYSCNGRDAREVKNE